MDEKKFKKAIGIVESLVYVRKRTIEAILDTARKDSFYSNEVTALKTAIEALEKQLPKKVISYHNENINREQYRCPVCENLVLTEDITTSLFGTDKEYCDKCGQRLDWSEC